MRGVVMYAPGDVRVEELEDAKIAEPTDMGHEYVGVVEQIGRDPTARGIDLPRRPMSTPDPRHHRPVRKGAK